MEIIQNQYQPEDITTVKLHSKLIFTTDGDVSSFEPYYLGLYALADPYFDDYEEDHFIGYFLLDELNIALPDNIKLKNLYTGSDHRGVIG